MPKPLVEFTTMTFDCYGTLVDWETGIWQALQPLLNHNERTDLTRSVLLEAFAEAESRVQERAPSTIYSRVLALVHRRLAGGFGLSTTMEMDEAFGASVPRWPAFDDSAVALAALKERYRLVILSNVHRDGFAASAKRLGVEFDAVYTAQDIGSYKPDSRNFQYLLDHLSADFGIGREEVIHVAQSLYHDHVPAQAFGLATVWIDRQRLSEGGEWGATSRVEAFTEPSFTFFSMAELAEVAASGGGP